MVNSPSEYGWYFKLLLGDVEEYLSDKGRMKSVWGPKDPGRGEMFGKIYLLYNSIAI